MVRSLYLKITNRCNLRCSHCYISEFKDDMDLSTVESVAKKYLEAQVIFHGGEPTIMGAEYIKDAVSILGKRHLTMQSNLTNINGSIIKIIVDHFDSNIGTSFDTSRLPYLDKILDNTYRLAENGIAVGAVVTVTDNMTYEVLKEFADRFQDFGGYSFTLQFATPIRSQIVTPSRYLDLFKGLYDHPLNKSSRRISRSICGGLSGINGGNCATSLRTIDPDGSIYICPDFAGQKVFRLGNVNREGEIVNHTPCRIYNERETQLSLTCDEECWHICKGGCLSNAYFIKGDYYKKDPYCSTYKEIISYSGSKAMREPAYA